MDINFEFEPTQWQSDVLKSINEHTSNSIFVIKSGRQRGKSKLLEALLIKIACSNKNSVSIAVSPTLSQALKLYQDIQKPILGTPILKGSNSQRLSLTFWNGSELLFKSAQQSESLRGYTVSNGGVLVIDEAAYIKDEIFYICQPFVSVSRASIILTSTPRYKMGFFYDFYNQGINGSKNVFSFDWADSKYDMSRFISPEMLEAIRKQTPILQYQTEYLAQFLDLQSNVFGDFSNCFSGEVKEGLEEVLGIDWGSGNGGDYTSICAINSEKQITKLTYFNDKDSSGTITEIIKIIKERNPKKVIVEKNSIGSVYYDLLKKEIQKNGIQVILQTFNTTNDSKYELVSNLQVSMNNREILLPKDDELITELLHFQTKPSSTGKPTFNSENGFHDDLIFSIMLALHALKKNNSSFMFRD